jgi:diguanylate cyclase (GGDEF)-like protein
MTEKSCPPGSNCAQCIWSGTDKFCDVLSQASVPRDEKWPLVILYLRGIKDIKNLSEVQKNQLQAILLNILRAKNYSQTRYDEVQESIFSTITLPYQEKLDQFIRETSELAKDMGNLFGRHREEVATIAQDVETGITDGNDPAELLADIRDSLKSVVAKMEQDSDTLVGLTLTDGLTGLANRRCFDVTLNTYVDRWKTTHDNVSLIMFDIDHFKNFNDTYGHPVGDEVLRTLAAQVKSVVDPLQEAGSKVLAARYGGEEFCVLLNGEVTKNAVQIAEQLRQAIHQRPLRLLDAEGKVIKKGLRITVSVGVADISANWGGAYQANLVDCADKALYHAKNRGRNCSVRYAPETPAGYIPVSAEE